MSRRRRDRDGDGRQFAGSGPRQRGHSRPPGRGASSRLVIRHPRTESLTTSPTPGAVPPSTCTPRWSRVAPRSPPREQLADSSGSPGAHRRRSPRRCRVGMPVHGLTPPTRPGRPRSGQSPRWQFRAEPEPSLQDAGTAPGERPTPGRPLGAPRGLGIGGGRRLADQSGGTGRVRAAGGTGPRWHPGERRRPGRHPVPRAADQETPTTGRSATRSACGAIGR